MPRILTSEEIYERRAKEREEEEIIEKEKKEKRKKQKIAKKLSRKRRDNAKWVEKNEGFAGRKPKSALDKKIIKVYKGNGIWQSKAVPYGSSKRQMSIGYPEEFWEEIFTKYRTGQYTYKELSDMFNVKEDIIRNKINKRGIKVNENAKKAIALFEGAFGEINAILNGNEEKMIGDKVEKLAEKIEGEMSPEKQQQIDATSMALVVPELNDVIPDNEAIKPEVIDHEQSVKLANEIVELVSQKNPQFARGIQALTSIMLERAEEILNSEKGVTSTDLKNISNALKDIDSTMSIFPKQPTIAQQFNFGREEKAKKFDTNIKLNINVIGRKK